MGHESHPLNIWPGIRISQLQRNKFSKRQADLQFSD